MQSCTSKIERSNVALQQTASILEVEWQIMLCSNFKSTQTSLCSIRCKCSQPGQTQHISVCQCSRQNHSLVARHCVCVPRRPKTGTLIKVCLRQVESDLCYCFLNHGLELAVSIRLGSVLEWEVSKSLQCRLQKEKASDFRTHLSEEDGEIFGRMWTTPPSALVATQELVGDTSAGSALLGNDSRHQKRTTHRHTPTTYLHTQRLRSLSHPATHLTAQGEVRESRGGVELQRSQKRPPFHSSMGHACRCLSQCALPRISSLKGG